MIEPKRSGRISERRAEQTSLANCRSKKKGNYRKIQRPAALIIDIYPLWIVSPPQESLESRAR